MKWIGASIKYLLFIVSISSLCSCEHEYLDTEKSRSSNERRYLFLGHTYDHSRADNLVDARIEKLNLQAYDELWLGGDLCSATTKVKSTLAYLDDLFDLASSCTMWAVGNHDIRNGNTQWITEKTQRPLHYVQQGSGITRIVINSTIKDSILDNSCSHIDGQVNMIKNVCDTISTSSHLILLMHYVLWLNCEPDMQAGSAENADASWLSLRCDDGNQFQHVLYPDLIKVQDRGIQVIVISGDSGQYGKKYEYVAPSGIQFFMSGINNSFDMSNEVLVDRYNTNPDSVLIFEHNIERRELIGSFHELNEL